MHDDDSEHPQPDVLRDLRPRHARELGFCILAAAEYADRLSDQRERQAIRSHHDQHQA
jgi:hypothetical protein